MSPPDPQLGRHGSAAAPRSAARPAEGRDRSEARRSLRAGVLALARAFLVVAVALSAATGATADDTSDTTPPTAPSNIVVRSSTTSTVSIAWSPSSDNVAVTGYRVYRNGDRIGTTQAPAYTLTRLRCGRTYTVGVEARDAAGNRSSRTSVSVAPLACPDTRRPSAPTNVAVAERTATSITLRWSASYDNVRVLGYELLRAGALAGTTAQTSFALTGLSCGTAYTLAVRAYDAAGNRSQAASIAAATAACPAAETSAPDSQPPSTPANLAVESATPAQVRIRWNSSSDNVGVTGYEISLDGAAAGTTSALERLFTGLECGSSHSVGVRAYDAAGNRSGWATVTAATSPCPDTTPPSAPAGLVQTGAGETSARLSWQASTDNVGVVGYGIYIGTLLVASTTETSFVFTGLTCASTYGVAVDALDAANNRSPKTSFVVRTSACPPDAEPPSSPSGLAAGAVTQTGFTLSWTQSTDNVGVSGYELLLNGNQVGTTTGTSYSYAGLSCGTSYTAGVRARDAAGNRSTVATHAAVTAACPPPAGPPPPAPPRPPSGDLGRGVFAVFDNAWAGTDPAAESLRFDWAVFHGPAGAGDPDEEARRKWEAADPSSVSFEYQNWGMACPDTWTTCGFTLSDARARGFIARFNGAEASPSGYTYLKALDMGRPGFGLAWAQAAESRIALMAPRVDGVFLDDVNAFDSRLPRDGLPDGYASDAAYRQAVEEQLRIATEHLRARGRLTMANVGGIVDQWREPHRDDNGRLSGYADWTAFEFCGSWNDGSSHWSPHMANADFATDLIREAALLAASRGRGFVCQSWRPGRERFGDYYSRIVLEPGLRGSAHSDGDYRAPFPASGETLPPAAAPPVAAGPVWSRRLSDGTTLNVRLDTFEAWRS